MITMTVTKDTKKGDTIKTETGLYEILSSPIFQKNGDIEMDGQDYSYYSSEVKKIK